MSQTNTDYLLQITPAVTDRSYSATNTSGDAVRFDDHLSQASTLSGDDPQNRGSSSQRTETARYDRDDRPWSASTSSANTSNSSSPPTPQASPTKHDQSADTVSESKPRAENTNSDDHDTDKSDDSTAVEVAVANQTAATHTKKTDSKPEPKIDALVAPVAKAVKVSNKATTEAGDKKAIGNTNGQKSKDSALPEAVVQKADEAAKLVVDETADVATISEEPDEPHAMDCEGKQSKAEKSDASAAKVNKGGNARSEVAANNDSSEGRTGIGETSPEVAQKVNGNVEASAPLANTMATKVKSDADESSDDDSRPSSKNDTRADVRNDAPVATSKVDVAQLAGGIPSLTDTSANSPPKGKDNEQSTKPITAKGEPIAAAFARMTRNNAPDSHASTSGTNDLPQVDPSRFIGRVAKAFQTAQDRGGTLQLRLSPPELGALRIELSVKDGVLSASLQTENANARRLLLDNLPALRDRLAEQNIRVDRFDVDVCHESNGGQSDARGSQQQQFQHEPDQPAPRRPVQPQQRAREVAAPEREAIVPNVSDASLNLIV